MARFERVRKSLERAGWKALYDIIRQSLKNKGEFNNSKEGNYSGGGSGGTFYPKGVNDDGYVLDTINVPVTETFNDVFKRERNKGNKTFTFNGKLYSTDLGTNPNWKKAGEARVQETGDYLRFEQPREWNGILGHQKPFVLPEGIPVIKQDNRKRKSLETVK